MNDILKVPKIGRVVDNEDPENYQRIRVTIPNITEGIPKDDLPWYPILTKGTNNNSVSIPEIGSFVLVSFPNGDIYNGLVEGFLSSSPQQ
jgi:uncharacterized protein involved in type VI secretion and phage assembly